MRAMRIGSWFVGIVLAGVVAGLLGCKRDGGAIATHQKTSGPQSVVSPKRSSEPQPSPGSQAKVRIALRDTKGTEPASLSFCYDDGSAYDPQIRRIRMAYVSGDRRIYEVAAIGNAYLWREWPVGTVPRGFRLIEGHRLIAGTYEIYVDAVVGEGALRVSIDDRGKAKSLPWDEFDKTYDKRCELSQRTEPRVIPKVDLGKDDLLEMHRKEEGRR